MRMAVQTIRSSEAINIHEIIDMLAEFFVINCHLGVN